MTNPKYGELAVLAGTLIRGVLADQDDIVLESDPDDLARAFGVTIGWLVGEWLQQGKDPLAELTKLEQG